MANSRVRVEFNLAAETNDQIHVINGEEHVLRRAPMVFKLGNYPDKKFSLNEDEGENAIANFKPCAIGLEHIDTVLSGKLGKLVSLSWGDGHQDGAPTFAGQCLIPTWLDKSLKPHERKLSVAFDRETKQIIGCDLVLKPRVNGAAMMSEEERTKRYGQLMAAFSHSNSGKELQRLHAEFKELQSHEGTEQGEQILGHLLAIAKSFGASEAQFGTQTEDAALTMIESIAEGASPANFAEYVRLHEPNEGDVMARGQNALKIIHDETVQFGAACAICGESNGSAAYIHNDGTVSRDEHVRVQAIHDIAHSQLKTPSQLRTPVKHPENQSGPIPMRDAPKDADGDAGQEQNEIAKIAPGTPTGTPDRSEMPSNPNFAEGPPPLFASLPATSSNGQRQATPVQPVAALAPIQPQRTPGMTAEFAAERDALMAENQQLRAERQQAMEDKIISEAALYARQMIHDRYAYPREYQAYFSEYVQAAIDDQATGTTVTFSGMAMSRIDAMKARHLLRPQHSLTEELLNANGTLADSLPAGSQVLFNAADHKNRIGGENGSVSLKRKAELHAKSRIGRTTTQYQQVYGHNGNGNGNGHHG